MLRLLLVLLLLSTSAFATETRRSVENVVTVDTLGTMYSTITVPTTSSPITKSVSLENTGVSNIGVMYKATSSGVVNVSIQSLRSFGRPTSETLTDATYVVWNGAVTTNDTAWHMATLDTVTAPYLRFQITGVGSNDASTTLQIKVEKS